MTHYRTRTEYIPEYYPLPMHTHMIIKLTKYNSSPKSHIYLNVMYIRDFYPIFQNSSEADYTKIYDFKGNTYEVEESPEYIYKVINNINNIKTNECY